MGLSLESLRVPPKENSLSTTCWNSSALVRRSGSFSVMRRNQSLPIFTWVTSSASIQSSQNSRYGSPARSPNSFIVVNTSMARPSRARFTPARRNTGSWLQAASKSTVFSAYWPISVPIQSLSLMLISTWRASSHAWRAMSSFNANGASVPVSKSQHVRPAPSRAWISPTKMPCIRPRARSLASARSGVRRFVLVRLSVAVSTVRGSACDWRIVIWLNRSSRANSSTGKNLRIRPALRSCRGRQCRPLPTTASPGVPDGRPPVAPLQGCRAGTG